MKTNRQAIIDLLLAHGALSRVDLARATSMSKPTVTAVVSELLDEGILVEVGHGHSTGGRKPVLLRLGGNRALIAGLFVDKSACRAVVVNLDGQVLQQHRIPHAGGRTVESIVRTVSMMIESLFPIDRRDALIGVGVAFPGIVDARADLAYSGHFDWSGVPFRRMIEQRIDRPVLVMDNAHAAGMGELWHQGRELRENLAYFYLGDGIGGAIIIGRELYVGSNQAAAEMGHICVRPAGSNDPAGSPQFLEDFASTGAIAQRMTDEIAAGRRSVLSAPRPHAPAAEVADLVLAGLDSGDELCGEIFRDVAHYVGIAVANIISILNPDEVVLGSALARWGDRFVAAVRAEAEPRANNISFRAVRIRAGAPEEMMTPLGAAAMMLTRAGELLATHRAAPPTSLDRQRPLVSVAKQAMQFGVGLAVEAEKAEYEDDEDYGGDDDKWPVTLSDKQDDRHPNPHQRRQDQH